MLLSEQHATYILRAALKALGGLEITPRMKKAADDKFVVRDLPLSVLAIRTRISASMDLTFSPR